MNTVKLLALGLIAMTFVACDKSMKTEPMVTEEPAATTKY